MKITVDQQVPVYQSYAAERTRGLYNVDADDGSRFRLEADVPAERDDWQIGVVVGPSGSGKTSIARALAEHGWNEWDSSDWTDEPVIECLSRAAGGYAKATAALAAVGLGSVPSWLRPFGVLSNGEQFRANLALLLVASDQYGRVGEGENERVGVFIDEFSSVLDRQVAKVGAGAFAKAWRRQFGRQVVLITPHYDILEWVQPDWWLDTAEGLDEFEQDRGVVQAREGTFPEATDRAGYQGDWVGSVEC